MEANAMWEGVRNDARNELRLRILADAIFNVLRVLFPDDYDGVLANLQALKQGDEKDGDAF